MKKPMKKMSLIIVIIWMIIVFIFSNQNGEESTDTSQGFINWILNVISFNNEQFVIFIEPIIRKIAHYALYTIGGIALFNYTNNFNVTMNKKISYALIVGVIYAITDEIHQLFVPGRTGAIKDVCIDSLGIITGIIIGLIIYKIYWLIRNKNITCNSK